MPNLRIAHLRAQGQDMIIVPLDSAFEHKSQTDQSGAIDDLQLHARGAGLAGLVIPVWDAGGGRMAFIAPRPWHPFFASLSLPAVFAKLNKELSW
jgi:hypothetical protein